MASIALSLAQEVALTARPRSARTWSPSVRPAPQPTTCFVVLKGPNHGKPMSAYGLDEVLGGARRRAGLVHVTCHELRHTCLTRLREAGMALEAVQAEAQAGHTSIESTRIYLNLADDWLASQYRKAAEVIDAQVFANKPAASPSAIGSRR